MLQQRRRAGIDLERPGVECRDRRKIRREQVACLRLKRGRDELADAVAPFAGAARLGPGEIIEARARMRVEHAKRSRLLLQMRDDAGQHRMLDDVSDIAGVERVAIVHAALRNLS